MSQLNAKTLMLGQNADPTKNFKITVPTPEDGTLTIERANGADVMKFLAGGGVEMPGLPFSKAQNGYLTLPNGLILQWGNTNTLTTNFPVAFPNTPLRVLASLNWNSSEAAAGLFQTVNAFTPTSFTLGAAASSLAPPGSITWIAIGH